jgi:hypothetical protein
LRLFAPVVGERFKLRIVTLLRFDDSGTIVEWKDHR